MLKLIDLLSINKELENAQPQDILLYAWETFNQSVVVTSSFQTQSVPLLHIISKYIPEMPVVFTDTGFHFPETIEFRDRLVREFDLNLIVAKPDLSLSGTLGKDGITPLNNPDACCMNNKVTPTKMIVQEYDAWVSGIRHDQSSIRIQTPIISHNSFYSVYKFCPMINWTAKDIQRFIDENHLPRHPLWEKGYRSIGCAPCTAPISNGQGERSGRWTWIEKIECGLHEF